jgi:hypothetical protein
MVFMKFNMSIMPLEIVTILVMTPCGLVKQKKTFKNLSVSSLGNVDSTFAQNIGNHLQDYIGV